MCSCLKWEYSNRVTLWECECNSLRLNRALLEEPCPIKHCFQVRCPSTWIKRFKIRQFWSIKLYELEIEVLHCLYFRRRLPFFRSRLALFWTVQSTLASKAATGEWHRDCQLSSSPRRQNGTPMSYIQRQLSSHRSSVKPVSPSLSMTLYNCNKIRQLNYPGSWNIIHITLCERLVNRL